MFAPTVRPPFFLIPFWAVPPVGMPGIAIAPSLPACRLLKPPAAGRVATSGAIGPRPAIAATKARAGDPGRCAALPKQKGLGLLHFGQRQHPLPCFFGAPPGPSPRATGGTHQHI